MNAAVRWPSEVEYGCKQISPLQNGGRCRTSLAPPSFCAENSPFLLLLSPFALSISLDPNAAQSGTYLDGRGTTNASVPLLLFLLAALLHVLGPVASAPARTRLPSGVALLQSWSLSPRPQKRVWNVSTHTTCPVVGRVWPKIITIGATIIVPRKGQTMIEVQRVYRCHDIPLLILDSTCASRSHLSL